jgi:hypothetical protein
MMPDIARCSLRVTVSCAAALTRNSRRPVWEVVSTRQPATAIVVQNGILSQLCHVRVTAQMQLCISVLTHIQAVIEIKANSKLLYLLNVLNPDTPETILHDQPL